jgi:hypothetical protein
MLHVSRVHEDLSLFASRRSARQSDETSHPMGQSKEAVIRPFDCHSCPCTRRSVSQGMRSFTARPGYLPKCCSSTSQRAKMERRSCPGLSHLATVPGHLSTVTGDLHGGRCAQTQSYRFVQDQLDRRVGLSRGQAHQGDSELGAHPTFARDHEYKRQGTVSLLAGIDLLTRQVHALHTWSYKLDRAA